MDNPNDHSLFGRGCTTWRGSLNVKTPIYVQMMLTNRPKQNYQIKVFFVVLQDAFGKTPPSVLTTTCGALHQKRTCEKKQHIIYLGGGFKSLVFSHPKKLGQNDEPNLTSPYFSRGWLKPPWVIQYPLFQSFLDICCSCCWVRGSQGPIHEFSNVFLFAGPEKRGWKFMTYVFCVFRILF